MKRCARVLAAVLLAVLVLWTVLPGVADFGDFSGGSDFGGSDWGGSDWGGSDYGGSDWNYYGNSFSDANPSDILVFFMLFIVLVGASAWVKTRRDAQAKRQGSGARTVWGFQLQPMGDLPEQLPDFDGAAVSGSCESLYRRMQDAWGAGDLTPLRDDFTPDAYAQYARQLAAKTRRGEHAHCTVHSVEAEAKGWNRNDHEYMLAVEVTALITAWNTDDSGRVTSGSKTARKRMCYAWVLRRPLQATASLQYCPNCGHELHMNAGGTCPACGAPLEAPGRGWQLSSIQGISQETLT